MEQILIVGAGGHAQVVADILWQRWKQDASVRPIGYVDDNHALLDARLLNLPVLGTIKQIPTIAHDAVVIAIGDNITRQCLFETLRHQGERFRTACHPSAIIAPDVYIGPGSVLCAGMIVNPGCTIGANVILNTGCTVDHHNRVGDHAHIAPGVHLGGDVTIGTGALVGIGATVLPRRCIGISSVVGAGAVVIDDVPDGNTVVGVPARTPLHTSSFLL